MNHLAVAIMFSFSVGASGPAVAPYWKQPFRDDGCQSGGHKYSARLMDVPVGQSGEEWCRRTSADIEGRHFASPTKCVSAGGSGTEVWGEFWVDDPQCRPHFEQPEKQVCSGFGLRQYAATIRMARDWSADCKRTPLMVAGKYFNTPTRCKRDAFHVWGEFDVPDASCLPFFESAQAQGCSGRGTRQWVAVLKNATDWKADCRRTSNTVAGQFFASPSRCKKDQTRVWGEFDVADPACAAR